MRNISPQFHLLVAPSFCLFIWNIEAKFHGITLNWDAKHREKNFTIVNQYLGGQCISESTRSSLWNMDYLWMFRYSEQFINNDLEWSWTSFLGILNLSKSTASLYCFCCCAFVMYRVRKKMPLYFASNFAKSRQIFKLLSLAHLAVNLQWSICQRSYHTSARC